MRTLIPPVAICKEFVDLLEEAWDRPSLPRLRAALVPLCEWFQVPIPRVHWLGPHQRRRDRLAETFDDGHIHAMHPEHFQTQKATFRGRRVPRDFAGWVHAIGHEIYHYVWWVKDETKADQFGDMLLHRGTK